MNDPILIVGAGQAGLQAADALRAGGYTGALQLIGNEAHAPYHRPPLSKAYLLGETTPAQLTIRSAEALAKKEIGFLPGVQVAALDRARRRIELTDGRELAYHALCLATGARPRTLALPGGDLPGVLALRTLDDAQAIAARLASVQQVVVIGGGFIGLEFAAVARKLGKEVVVLEAAERLMARAVAPQISAFYAQLHAGHGVQLVCRAQVTRITGSDGRASGVATADGREYPAGLVIESVGILPNDDLARAAGLECERGIVVDACSRTADPAIVAAGDCTARRLPDGRLLRLESVQNAVEQGRSAAATLLGSEKPFTAHPWFWSDQYDVKLQMAGLSAGHDRVVVRGEPAQRKFSAFYYRDDRLIAVDSVNRPADHLPARKLLDQGISPSNEQAADPDFALARLLA
jgi:3-phenylpropionate/trans-cinnamate dioxygenase ferredoxin reductase subunit